jgi:hypothetical protein
MNMGYCKFENTATALQECWDDWPADIDELTSEYERKGFERIVKLARKIVSAEGEE